MAKAALSIALVSALLITEAAARAQGAQPAASPTLRPLPPITEKHVNATRTEESYLNGGQLMRVSARDIYAMTGFNLDRWPYIESSGAYSPDIPGLNFMIPDNSRWGWRFLSRRGEQHVTTRAFIDVTGNAEFSGSLHAQSLHSGTPGVYSDSVLSWGNHLGGDFLTKLFSSATTSLHGVTASVLGISYSGVTVLAQDAYGNLAIFGNAVAKRFSATTLQANGATISADVGAPSAPCAIGDIYMRKDGAAGTTLYSCTATNTWATAGSAAPVAHQVAPTTNVVTQLAQAPFNAKVTGALTTLATVPITLRTSTGPKGNWYVCSIVEATAEGTAQTSNRVTYGIGTSNAGVGTPFRMYSRPQANARNGAFPEIVLSDWAVALGSSIDGAQIASGSGRYCNTYANGSSPSFTAYAIASRGTRPNAVFTSGQIEIQAIPQ